MSRKDGQKMIAGSPDTLLVPGGWGVQDEDPRAFSLSRPSALPDNSMYVVILQFDTRFSNGAPGFDGHGPVV